MSNIKIKICGIKTTAILDCCNELNINYCGLLFYNRSPRNINIKDAINLINFQKIENTIPIGVFVNHDFNDLSDLIKITNLKYIQLHGKENNDYISKLKDKINLTVIKTISVKSENDLKQIELYSQADFLLFDYKSKKMNYQVEMLNHLIGQFLKIKILQNPGLFREVLIKII